MSTQNWIEATADNIRSQWIEWEGEAEQLSQSQQDSRAGEQYLHRKLIEAITKGGCRLAAELEQAADMVSDCWLFIDEIARSEQDSPVGEVCLHAKLAAQRLLKRQKAPGWKI